MAGDGADKAISKCPFCGSPLTDEKHSAKVADGGTNIRDGGFAGIVLGSFDISTHKFYENSYTPQAHHLISISAMEKYGPLCRIVGYNINCKENCVFLPSSPRKACTYAVQKHRGSHLNTYFDVVRAEVENVIETYTEDPCESLEDFEKKKRDCKQQIENLGQTILNKINSFTFLLQNNSLNFINGSVIGCRQSKLNQSVKEKIVETINKSNDPQNPGNTSEAIKQQQTFLSESSKTNNTTQCNCGGRTAGVAPSATNARIGIGQ